MLNLFRRDMFLVAFYGVFTLGASSAFGEIPPAILIDPSPDDLIFLAYSLAGATPPFDTWGAADPSVTSLDEFHQAAAAQALSAKMQARYNKIKGTTEIRIAVDTTFGDYNTQYGEFDFDINDGTNVPYQTPLNQGGLIVNLTNGGLAQSWTISASDAEKVLALTKGSRNVVLTMTLKLNDATLPVESGDQIAIDATVLEYDIAEQFNSMRLGHVVVSQ